MPRTQIRASQITDLDITDADIAAANKDGLANVPCLRTLGTGAQQAAAGNHTHSGLVTNGNLHDHEGGDGAQIPTGGILDGAVTAAKLAVVDACRVYRTSDQIIPNATWTAISFNAERFDTNNLHDNTTNNTRLTARHSGVYLITFTMYWDSNTSGYRLVRFNVNAGTVILTHSGAIRPDGLCNISVSTIYYLNTNDYVEVEVVQTSGGNLAVKSGGNYSPEFGMVYLGRIS